MSAIRYELQISAEDYLAARRLSLRPRRAMRWALVVLGVPFLIVLAVDFYLGVSRGRSHPFLPSILGAGLFLLLWYYVLLPHQVRQIYQVANDSSAPPLLGELSATGVKVTGPGLSGGLTWADIVRWKHDRRMILLFGQDDEFTMIPLRAFAHEDDRRAALALLQQQLGAPVH